MSTQPICPKELEAEKVEFCKKLKSHRILNNLSQVEMAELINISPKTYRKMEKDFEIVNFETIVRLMKIFGNKESKLS
jgi:DNA-binding XRE family transcriptional regulator